MRESNISMVAQMEEQSDIKILKFSQLVFKDCETFKSFIDNNHNILPFNLRNIERGF